MTPGQVSRVRDGDSPFESELLAAEPVIQWICRRNRLSAQEAEDFASHVRLKIIEDDYAVLRKFQGRSTLRTFLTTVIQRLFLDYRIHLWGKWRPSSQARRAGAIAVQFEQLLTRDGHGFEEACEILQGRYGAEVDRATLERLAGQLPSRVRRSFESEEALSEVVAQGPGPEIRLLERDRQSAGAQASAALERAMRGLAPQDQLILALHFHDGRTVASIADVLRLDAKPLYRRLERLLQQLRSELETAGLRTQTVRDLLEDPGGHVELTNWGVTSARSDRPTPVKSEVER